MTTLALLAWPVITLILVLRMPFAKAAMISILCGFVLLPTRGGWDFPILPAFTKSSIPALTLLVLGFLVYRARASGSGAIPFDTALDRPGWIPRAPLAIVCFVVVFVGAQMTAFTNRDALVYGSTVLQGLRLYDGFSISLTVATLFVPLLLGRKFFAHPERHQLLLKGLVFVALGLSLLALYEIRMSPQINNLVYGFRSQAWIQTLRGGGFRPIVFMDHGLQLALFFAMATIAAFGLYRAVDEVRERGLYLLAGLWLLLTLFLSNSLGALLIALLLVSTLLLFGRRQQLLIGAGIAFAILTYPMLRTLDLIPTDLILSLVSNISEERAGSLRFRFNNEDVLLAHAKERALFGWGMFDRARVFTDWGGDTTTIDGFWIGLMGEQGWAGYVTVFGLLALPILLIGLAAVRYRADPATVALVIVLAGALIDLIPNGFLSPVTILIAGALWGHLEVRARVQAEAEGQPRRPDVPSDARQTALARTGCAGLTGSPAAAEQLASTRQSVYTRQTVCHRRSSNQH